MELKKAYKMQRNTPLDHFYLGIDKSQSSTQCYIVLALTTIFMFVNTISCPFYVYVNERILMKKNAWRD